MPDDLTPLFEDLRRRELPRVPSTGTGAIRRTLHRRAMVRGGAAAVVVTTATVTLFAAQRGDTVRPITPAAPAPHTSTGLWRGLPNKAEIAGGLVPGADHADVMGTFPHDVGMEIGAGRHHLRVGCSGPAPLPLTILLDDKVDQRHTVACEDAGAVADYEFTVPGAARVRIVLGNQGQFDAYALKVTKSRAGA